MICSPTCWFKETTLEVIKKRGANLEAKNLTYTTDGLLTGPTVISAILAESLFGGEDTYDGSNALTQDSR